MDVAKLVTLTLDSLGMEQELGMERSPALHRMALIAARAAITSELWADPSSRRLLLPAALDHVAAHLHGRRELAEAIGLVLEVVKLLKSGGDTEDDVITLAEKCIGPLGVAIVAEQELGDETEEQELIPASLVTALLGILELLSPSHHLRLWRTDSSLLSRLLTVLSEVMARPSCLPMDWLPLRLAAAIAISSALQMAGDCLPHLIFDKQLWMSYYRLSVTYITSPLLGVQEQGSNGSVISLEPVEDLRLPLARHMVVVWSNCPEKIQLVPSLVGPLLEVTLIPQREVRIGLGGYYKVTL